MGYRSPAPSSGHGGGTGVSRGPGQGTGVWPRSYTPGRRPAARGGAYLASRADLVVGTTVVVTTALALVGLVRLLAVVAEVLVLVLIAAILATGLAPLADRLERRPWGRRRWRLSRTAAAGVVYVGLLAALGLVGSVLVTPVVRETTDLAARGPELYGQLQAMIADLQHRYPWLPDLTGLIERLPEEAGRLTAYVGRATGVAFRVFGAVVSALSVLILSFYMLLEGPAIKAAFLRLFPRRNHRQLENVLAEIGRKFGGWLRGQLFLGLVVGLAAGLGTAALGLPYAFLLGLAAGVTELIPLVGPVLGAVPAVLVALFGPAWRLLAVIVLFVVIQQAENHFLVPRVTRQTVGLSPVLTLIAIMVGTKLMGVLGALLAVPVAAAIQVVVGELVRTYGPNG